jgi:ABC-type nickel/cobalt efflux system permease component RcnA
VTGFSELPQQTVGNAWLFVPSAVLLGALHALEPGIPTLRPTRLRGLLAL